MPLAPRPLAALAGPVAGLSLLLFFAALVLHGDSTVALSRSALGVTSSALALVSVGLLVLGLVQLAAGSSTLQDGRGRVAVGIAGAGTLLLAGGAWAQLVVLPALAVEAPALAESGTGLVTAGYITSFLVTGLGWLLVGLRLRADQPVRRGGVRLVLAGSVLMLAPLPTRWVFLAAGVTLLLSARRAPVTSGSPVAVPA